MQVNRNAFVPKHHHCPPNGEALGPTMFTGGALVIGALNGNEVRRQRA
jgi:hypothetical protein